MTSYGEVLRVRRQQAGLGLRTFAGLIDERASAVSAVESDRRAPWQREETILRVVEVLGCADYSLPRPAAHTTNGEVLGNPGGGALLWWWTTEEGNQLDLKTVAELAEFIEVVPISEDSTKQPCLECTWPSFTELAIEWRVRQLLGRRGFPVTTAPVDVEAALENSAGVRLEIIPGLVPRFSVQACVVREQDTIVLYVDRIVADSRPLASYRHLLATCYAPAALGEPAQNVDVDWFLALQQSDYWPQTLRDCRRFALSMLLPAGPVLGAAETAYQELVQQQGWVDVETAARTVRNRLAEQFAVPPALVHRRLVGWPCHVYGRIAQALAAEEMTLPPTDWTDHEQSRTVQRELFAK